MDGPLTQIKTSPTNNFLCVHKRMYLILIFDLQGLSSVFCCHYLLLSLKFVHFCFLEHTWSCKRMYPLTEVDK